MVATAARLCYSPQAADELWEALTYEKQKEFLAKLWSYGHYSPFEHVTFTFALTGVSRALSHQLVRHRIASYAQRSQRYINETDFPVVIPPTIQSDAQAEAITTVIRRFGKDIKTGCFWDRKKMPVIYRMPVRPSCSCR